MWRHVLPLRNNTNPEKMSVYQSGMLAYFALGCLTGCRIGELIPTKATDRKLPTLAMISLGDRPPLTDRSRMSIIELIIEIIDNRSLGVIFLPYRKHKSEMGSRPVFVANCGKNMLNFWIHLLIHLKAREEAGELINSAHVCMFAVKITKHRAAPILRRHINPCTKKGTKSGTSSM